MQVTVAGRTKVQLIHDVNNTFTFMHYIFIIVIIRNTGINLNLNKILQEIRWKPTMNNHFMQETKITMNVQNNIKVDGGIRNATDPTSMDCT